MSGSVEQNPGPPGISFGFVNAQSIVQKGSLMIDLISTHQIDVLAVCETFIANNDPPAIKLDCLPPGYRVVHLPRPTATRYARGGGLCVIHRDTLSVKNHPLQRAGQYESFESLLVNVDIGRNGRSSDVATIAVIYRPPSRSTSDLDKFYDDLSDLSVRLGDVVDADRLVMCGDLNCGSTDPVTIRSELTALLDAHGLQQHVSAATRTTATSSSVVPIQPSCRG